MQIMYFKQCYLFGVAVSSVMQRLLRNIPAYVVQCQASIFYQVMMQIDMTIS